jgi:hypothetical protein
MKTALISTIFFLFSSLIYSQTSKFTNQNQTLNSEYSVDDFDVIFVFYATPSQNFKTSFIGSNKEEYKTSFSNWLKLNNQEYNTLVDNNSSEKIIFRRSVLHALSKEKQLEFKLFYNSLDEFIAFESALPIIKTKKLLLSEADFIKMKSFFQ